MRNAVSFLIVGLAAFATAACNKPQQQAAQNGDEMSLDDNLSSGELPANADIETLPPDESSETSSGELNSGDDNPDVNDAGNGH